MPENNTSHNRGRAKPGNRKISPVEVPLSHAVNTDRQDAPWYRSRSLIAGLVASILLALFVVFALPSMVRAPQAPPEAVKTIQSVSAKPLESPWQDAQLAKARREAQDVLSKILEKQEMLEQRQVTQWGEKRFDLAMATAAEGDTYYRQRYFPESIEAYRSALTSLEALETDMPTLAEAAFKKGTELFEQGDAGESRRYFEQVLAMDPGHTGALEGLHRSRTLNQVLQLVDNGNDSLDQGKPDDASQFFSQALELDNQFLGARVGKTTADKLTLERNFNQAMSAGYSALQAGDLSEAEAAFVQAKKLRPEDAPVRNALAQTRNQRSQERLGKLMVSGKKAEADEEWNKATAAYQQILDTDSSLIDARVGNLRATTRARLNDEIEKVLADPMRLATNSVFQTGNSILADARGIRDPGPKLKAQIEDLQTSLTTAATPVPVQLVSDGHTEVAILKVGEFGRFSTRHLELKPGKYVATGSRPGYRDVRLEFHVTGPPPAKPISIICTEPVS